MESSTLALADVSHWPLVESVIDASSERSYQLTAYLLNNQCATTAEVRQACTIENIADVAAKANPYLAQVGLFITCELERPKSNNCLVDLSNAYRWYCTLIKDAPAIKHATG